MRILTNSVDKLPVLVTVLLKRARAVSGLPADTPIEVVDDLQAEDIRITLGTVKGYRATRTRRSRLSRSSATRKRSCSLLRRFSMDTLGLSILAWNSVRIG